MVDLFTENKPRALLFPVFLGFSGSKTVFFGKYLIKCCLRMRTVILALIYRAHSLKLYITYGWT